MTWGTRNEPGAVVGKRLVPDTIFGGCGVLGSLVLAGWLFGAFG